MKYKCVKCGQYATGPVQRNKTCPSCGCEMVPVVESTTEDGKKTERTLKLFEEGRE